MKSEFDQFCKLATARKFEKLLLVQQNSASSNKGKSASKASGIETSLQAHFFRSSTKDGTHHVLT